MERGWSQSRSCCIRIFSPLTDFLLGSEHQSSWGLGISLFFTPVAFFLRRQRLNLPKGRAHNRGGSGGGGRYFLPWPTAH